jgi:hypothetical protein
MHLLTRRAGLLSRPAQPLGTARSTASMSSMVVPAGVPPDDERPTVRLAIVGDVHGDWCERRDGAALEAIARDDAKGLDAVLLVGDFGEEALPMVAGLAAPPPAARPRKGGPPPPRIVMLGNHDAWFSLTPRGRRRAAVRAALAAAGLPTPPKLERPQQRELRRGVEAAAALAAEAAEERAGLPGAEPEDPAVLGAGAWAQLQALGDAHAGFRHWGGLPARAVDDDDGDGDGDDERPRPLVSVVGARPFSKGGGSIADCARFYRAFYGLSNVEQAAARVARAAREAPPGRSLVVLAHNGPAGMGALQHDPCGVDWLKGGAAGDHGDVDLRLALDALHEGAAAAEEEGGSGGGGGGGEQGDPMMRRHVALVVHGHMHGRLRAGGQRRMVHVDAERRTVVLNAATVPRVRRAAAKSGGNDDDDDDRDGDGDGDADAKGGASTAAATLRHFLVVELRAAGAEEGGDGEGEAARGFDSADVERAEDVWVRVEEEEEEEEGAGGRRPSAVVAERQEVLRTARGEGGGGVLKLAWDASAGRWTQHVWRQRRRVMT